MKTEVIEMESTSSGMTEDVAAKMGRKLRGGEIIELIGDLGAGKTTFVRGLARGLDSNDQVSSPTFMIYRVYDGRVPLYHFDMYRLQRDPMVLGEFKELLENPGVVIVVEWASQMPGMLPEDVIGVALKAVDEDIRRIDITIPDRWSYLR